MTYRSHADLGGEDLPGAIVQEPEGEYFHAPWEPRVMALVVAMGPTGMSNIDMNRSVRETLPNYRDLSYYEIWLAALEKLALQKGVLGDSPKPWAWVSGKTCAPCTRAITPDLPRAYAGRRV